MNQVKRRKQRPLKIFKAEKISPMYLKKTFLRKHFKTEKRRGCEVPTLESIRGYSEKTDETFSLPTRGSDLWSSKAPGTKPSH